MKSCYSTQFLIWAALLFFNFSVLGLAEEKKDDSPELSQARSDFQKQVKTMLDPITKKYIQRLEDLKKKLGAKGDIDGAKAVQDEITRLKSIAPDSLENEPNSKDATTEKVLLGKWSFEKKDRSYSAIWTFQKDGIVLSNNGTPRGNWEIRKDVVYINWGGSAWEEFVLPLNPNSTECNSHVGGSKCGVAKKKTSTENCLVIWNQHNAHHDDRGTKKVNIIFYDNNQEINKIENQELKWEKGKDCKNTFSLPDKEFDKVRVEIIEHIGLSGGLSEIEIWKDGENIALKSKVSVSGVFSNNNDYSGDRLIDGITSSSAEGVGFWLLHDKATGWCELSDFNKTVKK